MSTVLPIGAAPQAAAIRTAIAGAAARTNVDFDFLMAQAQVESGLDPRARARTSSAAGLFQFTRQTWLETLARHGAQHGLGWAANAIAIEGGRARIIDPALAGAILDLRLDPAAAALMAGELAADNATFLQEALGRPVDQTELYLAHFLGAEGARRFITAHAANPEASAAALFPEAAAANRAVFYERGEARSLGAVRSVFAAKLAEAGADGFPAGTHWPGPGLMPAPADRALTPAPAPVPPDRPRRASMAEVLATALGPLGGRVGSSSPAPAHVARAYQQLARFGL